MPGEIRDLLVARGERRRRWERRFTVTFALDEELLDHGWSDMQAAPVVGDLVNLPSVGVEETGMASVTARCWLEHNWLVVYLERLP